MAPERVDFFVTCYNANVDRVLTPGFLASLAESALFPFSRRVLLINNVDDVSSVVDRAELRRQAGEIDTLVVVDEHLNDALSATGMDAHELGRIAPYSTWAFVAAHVCASEWLLHWDVDCVLTRPSDWVRPSLDRMGVDSRLLVANPAWSTEGAIAESLEHDHDFAIGYGFSDQVFLARRAVLARPIYREQHVASLRYPLAHIAPTFECRVDSYMRVHERLRATFLRAEYRHVGVTGQRYPRETWRERWRRKRYRAQLRRWRNATP